MAMPMPAQGSETKTQEPVSGTRAARMTPDQEAMLLMTKIVERALVAKSFAKIAAGLLTATAASASVHLRAAADAKISETIDRTIDREGGIRSRVESRVEHVKKLARVAAESAAAVAARRVQPEAQPDSPPDSQPETQPEPETQPAPVTEAAAE